MVAFVQAASGTGTSGSATVTLGSNTTAGNCLVVCVALGNASGLASVTSVTLGGSNDNFAQLKAVGDLTTGAEQLATWADPNCAGGQTSVQVTLTLALTCLVWVFEFSGVVSSNVLDQSATFDSAAGTNSTFSVTTGTTTQASEVAVGSVYGFGTTITGPSSPWVNESTISSGSRTLQAGYDILSSTGTVTYSGSFGAAAFNGQILVTLKGAAAVAAAAARSAVSRGRAAASRGRTAASQSAAVPARPVQAVSRGRAAAGRGSVTARQVTPVPARPQRAAVKAAVPSARPGRVVVIRSTGAGVIPPPPPAAIAVTPTGMLDRRPGYLKKRILLGNLKGDRTWSTRWAGRPRPRGGGRGVCGCLPGR